MPIREMQRSNTKTVLNASNHRVTAKTTGPLVSFGGISLPPAAAASDMAAVGDAADPRLGDRLSRQEKIDRSTGEWPQP